MPTHHDKGNHWFENLLAALVILILGFTIYSNVLHGEFVSDDYIMIVDNLAVRNLTGIGQLWQGFNTRILVGLTFALNYWAGGLNVFGYHVVNISVHVLNAFLIYLLVLLTFDTPALKAHPLGLKSRLIALLAALIFLCHPIQTQGVSFITQRAVSLATFFYLLTLLCYVKARLNSQTVYYAVAVLAMLLGIFSKENTATIPLILLLYEMAFLGGMGQSVRQRLSNVLPFFLCVGLQVFVLMQDQPGSLLALKGKMGEHGFSWNYFFTEVNVLRTYLRLLVFPVNQCHEYDYTIANGLWEAGTLMSAALLSGLLSLAVMLWNRQRLMSFCIFWFFITTSVEVMVVSIVHRAILYEHWLYLPMIGFAIFVSVALGTFFVNERSLKRVGMGLVILLSMLTYQRNFVWQSAIGLWEDNKVKMPNMPNVYLGAGAAYQRKGYYHLARENYLQTIEFLKKHEGAVNELGREFYSRVYNNLGLVHYFSWEDSEALAAFEKSLEFNPNNAGAYHNLGVFYFQTEDYRNAVKAFKQSLALRGDYPDGYRYLGLCYSALGQADKAQEAFRTALKLISVYGDLKREEEIREYLSNLKTGLKG